MIRYVNPRGSNSMTQYTHAKIKPVLFAPSTGQRWRLCRLWREGDRDRKRERERKKSFHCDYTVLEAIPVCNVAHGLGWPVIRPAVTELTLFVSEVLARGRCVPKILQLGLLYSDTLLELPTNLYVLVHDISAAKEHSVAASTYDTLRGTIFVPTLCWCVFRCAVFEKRRVVV